MTNEARKSAYLGGIGTMLTQSNICPTCGRIHETGLMKFVGGAAPGRVAYRSGSDASPIGYAPIGEPSIVANPRRVRSNLAAPWPMPPIAEEL